MVQGRQRVELDEGDERVGVTYFSFGNRTSEGGEGPKEGFRYHIAGGWSRGVLSSRPKVVDMGRAARLEPAESSICIRLTRGMEMWESNRLMFS